MFCSYLLVLFLVLRIINATRKRVIHFKNYHQEVMYQIDEQIGDEANHCKLFLENKEVISLSRKF